MTAIDCLHRPVDAALWLARAFVDGRRLAVHAPGAPDHAHHVAVEFVHPVVAGARPLPATVADVEAGVDEADALLVIGPADPRADLHIDGRGPDAGVIRAYHLLWELVHIALEHLAPTRHGAAEGGDAGGGDSTGFLYPFLDDAGLGEADLRRGLESSAAAKRAESERLAVETVEVNRDRLVAVAEASVSAAAAGRRILTMGNGGSATDAGRLARRLRALGLAADSLSTDYAVLTALANDLGVESVFVRQLEALGASGDVVVGFSTSGSSPNLLAAFAAASKAGMTTVGISGYGGGSFATEPSLRHRLVVDSQSVHRIQEAQGALVDVLLDRIGAAERCGALSLEAGS